MIVHDVAQHSAEWWRLRMAIPTASAADKLLTPKTLKPSKQREAYMNALLAEWMTGIPSDDYQSRWMERGQELEEEAWAYYELAQDVEVVRGGFVTTDDGRIGASPDGRIYRSVDVTVFHGGVELKCPSAPIHVGYMRRPITLLEAYRGQACATLAITNADWWDLMSYHPLLPPVLLRVVASAEHEYIVALREAYAGFASELETEKERLRSEGIVPRKESSG